MVFRMVTQKEKKELLKEREANYCKMQTASYFNRFDEYLELNKRNAEINRILGIKN